MNFLGKIITFTGFVVKRSINRVTQFLKWRNLKFHNFASSQVSGLKLSPGVAYYNLFWCLEYRRCSSTAAVSSKESPEEGQRQSFLFCRKLLKIPWKTKIYVAPERFKGMTLNLDQPISDKELSVNAK